MAACWCTACQCSAAFTGRHDTVCNHGKHTIYSCSAYCHTCSPQAHHVLMTNSYLNAEANASLAERSLICNENRTFTYYEVDMHNVLLHCCAGSVAAAAREAAKAAAARFVSSNEPASTTAPIKVISARAGSPFWTGL